MQNHIVDFGSGISKMRGDSSKEQTPSHNHKKGRGQEVKDSVKSAIAAPGRKESPFNDVCSMFLADHCQMPLFMEHAPAAIAMFDTDMCYIAASRRWLSDYNLGNTSIIGKSHYDVFPEIPKRWKSIYQRCLKGAVEISEEEAFPRLDGSVDWVKWVISPWRTRSGSIGGLIMFTEVITERKQERERLRTSLMQLRHKARELETINRELDSFSSSVSHDLKAPLKLIEGYSGLLRANYSKSLDTDGQKCLKNITRAVRRMNGLIKDLMKLSQLSMSNLKFQDVDISELVRGIIAELKSSEADERSVEIAIEDDLVVVADRRLIRIALDNLLRNAWKFTEDESHAKIRVGQTKNSKGKQVIFIQDNGVGFDMSRAEELFLTFSRTHEERFGGDGVGLATVRRIISRHGGSVWAEGKLGKGATFSFTLD